MSQLQKIVIVGGMDRILGAFRPQISQCAARTLANRGVEVRVSTMVTSIEADSVTVKCGDRSERIATHTVLWAAGVKASPLGEMLRSKTGAPLDRPGRVIVEPDFNGHGTTSRETAPRG